jgi:membrane carboxypeptidase/penicillin-binding protein
VILLDSDHSGLDSVKIAKATKHTLSALYCITENAFAIYIQLARLFFDARVGFILLLIIFWQ